MAKHTASSGLRVNNVNADMSVFKKKTFQESEEGRSKH